MSLVVEKFNRLDKVMRDGSIKGVPKGEFRLELFLQDVRPDVIKFVEPERLKGQFVPEDREEAIGVMYLLNLPVSNFGVYYTRKISRLDSKHFEVLIDRLMWMNEGIDFEGIKRMVEHIHYYWIKDKVAIGKRDVIKKVLSMLPLFAIDNDNITHTKSVFYKKNSFLTSNEKMRITRRYREANISELLAEIIHTSTMLVIEVRESKAIILKLGNKEILTEVQTKKNIRTVRTMVKHMNVKTVTAILEHNDGKVFKTARSLAKYEKFLTLPSGTSNRRVSRKLGISLSTVQQYREISKR